MVLCSYCIHSTNPSGSLTLPGTGEKPDELRGLCPSGFCLIKGKRETGKQIDKETTFDGDGVKQGMVTGRVRGAI